MPVPPSRRLCFLPRRSGSRRPCSRGDEDSLSGLARGLRGWSAGLPDKPVPSVVVSRLPASAPVVVAKQWAEASARGRNDLPWFRVTATLVRATSTTTPVGGGQTRTLMSDRTAWLVLIPDEQALAPGRTGPFNWAFTRAVLIDATSGDYLGGALLPSSSMR